MPVAQQDLEARIDEIAGGDPEFRKQLLETIGAKPEAATRLVNGFLGRADVTRKQQEIATQRQQIEQQQQQFQEQLTQAEADKAKIMRDLSNSRISEATANARLQSVKETYALSDEDIPSPTDVRQTAKTGQVVDSTPDIDEKLKTFKQELMNDIGKQLIPELSALSSLDAIWDDINYDHKELLGKRMSKTEKTELLTEARKNNISLEAAWQQKYNIGEKRQEVHDKTLIDKERIKWEDEMRAKGSELALEGVRQGKGRADFFDSEKNGSPVFKAKFEQHTDPVEQANAGTKTKDGAGTPPKPREARGAEKAAAIYMERARNGQLGKPLEEARR